MSAQKKNTASAMADTDKLGARITTAAARVIIEHGLAGASMDTIARYAKTSKRSIYERFPNKEALFENVMVYLCEQATAAPDVAREDADLRASLSAIAHSLLLRFRQADTRKVLAEAIGSAGQFPEALNIFWELGPGQAALAVGKLLKAHKSRCDFSSVDIDSLGQQFVYDCSGPIVLRMLINSDYQPTDDEVDQHIASTVERLLVDVKAQL